VLITRNVAIIPARGGSKRIPKQNILPFLGKPIIAYSIETALESGLFDEVMVSTDDSAIADIAREHGAVIPFMRDQNTANDRAVIAEVCSEVLQKYQLQGKEFDNVCMIMATAPFVTAQRLKEAYSKLSEGNYDCIMTVTEYSFPIQRSFKLENGLLLMRWPENIHVRSQDLEKTYHDAGQFCFFKVNSFLKQRILFMERTGMILLDAIEVQDIDTPIDWELAELKYQFLRSKKQ